MPVSTRKRARDVDLLEDQENRLEQSKPKPAKLAKSSDGTPLQATQTKKKSTATKSAKPANEASKSTKAAEKQYKAALKSVDKKYKEFLKRYKPNPTVFSGVTADDFAKAMARFLPEVETLLATSPKHAFNLLMYLGDHAYGDLEACIKSSGWGDTKEPFKEMDNLMLKVIEKRIEADDIDGVDAIASAADDQDGDSSEGELAAFVSLLGGKRPNKSERNQIDKWRRVDFQNRVEKAQLRRETVTDWVSNALRDLIKTKEEIDDYGIGDHYFQQSIAKLHEIKSAKGTANSEP
jgi:hypothetical protein